MSPNLSDWFVEYDEEVDLMMCTHNLCVDGFFCGDHSVAYILEQINEHVCK